MVEIYGVHNAVPFGWVLILKTWARARSDAHRDAARAFDATPVRKPAAPPRWIQPR